MPQRGGNGATLVDGDLYYDFAGRRPSWEGKQSTDDVVLQVCGEVRNQALLTL